MIEFQLPHMGENVELADVVRVLVAPGDTVRKDQPVIEVETEKTTFEVPSSVDGTVLEVLVRKGDKVRPGQAVLKLEPAAEATAAPPAEPAPAASAAPPDPPGPPAAAVRTKPAPTARRTRRMRTTPAEDTEVVVRASGVVPAEEVPVPASPAVRRFAREIGVDIRDVPGSGPGGRISIEDVKRFAQQRAARAAPPAAAPAAVPAPPLPNFSRWGPVRREPMSNVRRVTARQMALAWSAIPHVTLHASADVTELEQLRARYKAKVERGGGRLTLTVLLVKAVAEALPQHPRLNASIDLEQREIVLKEYVHVGVATDTDRGLLVPVVRDAHRKTILRLAVEMADLVDRARGGKLSLEEMQGASFTVTNLGAGPVTWFTPIVNHPEVALLGVGRAYEEAGRRRLPLSLSLDHRAVDGADGARFLSAVVDTLEHPLMLVLED